MTPSCVAFTPSQLLVGQPAKKQVEDNPTNTIYDSKRLIGRKSSDKILQKDEDVWPFTLIPRKGVDTPLIALTYKGEVKHFAPEQISSMVMGKMKETVEAYIGTEVKKAVVSVPAYFNNFQRQATIDAGAIAGLNVIRIINEPTAAAIAYGHMQQASNCNVKPRNIVVFDLGGGTFDVSLVTVAKNSIVVKATSGDAHLGGVDFDNNVVNYFVDKFKRKHNKDINGNHKAVERLRVACEKAKRSLSSITKIPIEIDCLYEGVDFSSTLSRVRFETLNMILFEKCIEAIQKCLTDAKMIKKDVDDVVLVGGSTRIPKIQELLQEFFDGKQLCKVLNPDEAVAYGAAIQAANLSGIRQYQHLLVSDVTPLSLATSYDYGKEVFQIPRNTPIPTKMDHKFSSVVTNSKYNVVLTVSAPKDINFYNKFVLSDFNTNNGSEASVMTTFTIDVNNILTVTSVEQWCTGRSRRQIMKEAQLTVYNHSGNLYKYEINKMGEEARKYKMENMVHVKTEKARFEVEKFVSNMSDTLGSYGKIKSTYKTKLKDSIKHTNHWLDLRSQLNDARMFEDKLKELQENFTDENKMKEAKESKIKDMELRKARLDLEAFVSNMSHTLSSYGKIKSTYKKKLKDSIKQTNLWLLLNAQLNDARMFEDKLKELQENFTHKNMMKDVKEFERKDMELRKARLDMETFVSNMSDTLSSYGKIKSTYKKKLRDSIQQTKRWLDLNSQVKDARMFEDKLKELQDNFTDENRMKEVKESKMKDMERIKAKLDLEMFMRNMSNNLSNYYNIKFEDRMKLKYAIKQTNDWLDLNVLLNDACKFEDKLKELQEICNPSQDASCMPKKSSFFFSFPENGENSSNVGDQKYEPPNASDTPKKSYFFFLSIPEDGKSSSHVQHQKYEAPQEAEKEAFKWLSSWMFT